MVRLVRFAILLGCALIAGHAFATTYYVAANGSDSNNGTSTSTPWQHAPGMTGCSGNCASKTPQAGDKFILRGGDAWFPSGAGTPVGLPWNFGWSGNSGSRIYVGVDQTMANGSGAGTTGWYDPAVCGPSWCRPRMNGGNPPSTSAVSACAHTFNSGNDTNVFTYVSGSYLTFDNFEYLGLCYTGYKFGSNVYMQFWSSYGIIQNMYLHGWTHTSAINGNGDGGVGILGTTSNTATHNQIIGLVCDGSDTDKRSLGYCVYGDLYDIHNSVFRYIINGAVGGNCSTIHDNLAEYVSWNGGPYDTSMHDNVFECNNSINANGYYYNNLIRHARSAVTFWTCARQVDYIFNNIQYDIGSQGWDLAGSNASPCVGGGQSFIYNNTMESGGANFQNTTQGWNGDLKNNLYINGASALGNGTHPETNATVLTTAEATARGFTASADFVPTDSTCNGISSKCPMSSGANLSNACSSAGNALCADMAGVQYDAVNHRAIYPRSTPVQRPSGSVAWDVGAVQSTLSSATRPTAPAGLVATVK
jgi:hypothetical protein